ncbi:MAG: caspase domain-containing protein [Bacteroidales bacterium]
MKIKNLLIIPLLFSAAGLNAQISSESVAKYYSISSKPAVGESNFLSVNLKRQNQLSSESIGGNYSIISENSSTNTSRSNYYSIGSPSAQKTNIAAEINSSNSLAISKTTNIGKNSYAVIIGNEDYTSFQPNLSAEQNVPFAINDASSFKELCLNTLGLPTENIVYLKNAGFVQIKKALDQINLISKYSNGAATLLFYYAGHGLPDELSKEPYIIPVDVSSSSLEYAIPLKEIYSKLTEYSSKKVVVFFDACFTGAGRNTGLKSSRGVKVKPKETPLPGNIIVFCSSRETESSLCYREKQHGLFSYFLIDKVAETKGKITLFELDKYLRETVPLKSILINKQEQTPQTYISINAEDKFKQLKLIE